MGLTQNLPALSRHFRNPLKSIFNEVPAYSAMVPVIDFETSRVVNEFCHFSVLYGDLMPTELSTGMLANKAYQERNHHLRQDAIRLQLQKIGPFSSQSEWYEFVRGLMKIDQSGGFRWLSGNGGFVAMFQDLRDRRAMGFDDIWKETRPRLEEYRYKFESQWAPISGRVLSRLSELAKSHWATGKILVHFIDCLYGGFAWNDCVGFAPFPDLDVQKKFLAHELSELITPQEIVRESLRKAGFDIGMTHTVVDMLAYFSVREFLPRPVPPNREKKGIRPNPSYYPGADALFPIFEEYADNPSKYSDFADLVEDMIRGLRSNSISSTIASN